MQTEGNYSCLLAVPFGYGEQIGEGYPGTPAKELSKAFGGDFSKISFKVDFLSSDVYSVTIKRLGIITIQGKTDLMETVTGRQGDTMRLMYGQSLTIEGTKNNRFLFIRISSKFEDKD